MATEGFDVEAALANVHSASGRRPKPEPVERVHVFLPERMRAEQKQPEKKKQGKAPWFVKQPDWDVVLNKNSTTTEPVQTSAQQLSLPGTAPVHRRKFGCSICNNKTVQCKDDGSPYEHKCSHRKWCRTKSGHPICEECENELIVRVEQAKLRQSAAQQEFAKNLRQAEKAHPPVGWDIVEVTSASTCPICQKFLQGNRAVRVWVKKEGEWQINNLQCLHHRPRPGVPLQETVGQSAERDWSRLTTVSIHNGVSVYQVVDGERILWEGLVLQTGAVERHNDARSTMNRIAREFAAGQWRPEASEQWRRRVFRPPQALAPFVRYRSLGRAIYLQVLNHCKQVVWKKTLPHGDELQVYEEAAREQQRIAQHVLDTVWQGCPLQELALEPAVEQYEPIAEG